VILLCRFSRERRGLSGADGFEASRLQEARMNMKKTNVLVFPGGTEIALEIWRALKDAKDVRLYSASIAVSNHAPYVFARHFTVPSVHEQNWIEELNRVIAGQSIDYVFPAHDDAVIALAENANRIDARIISSPVRTCRIARLKSRTYETLRDVVPVPRVFGDPGMIDRYPIFVKPDKGQGSQGVHIAYDRGQVDRLLLEDDGYLVTEYLPGEEITVDCFSDRDRGLLFCQGRQRTRTRSGISVHSITVHDKLFGEYARAISARIAFHGAWFFQLKKDREGIFKLLEVAPRIAGTMALHRVKGVNFALLSIYEQERIPLTILENSVDVEIDRALVNRYSHQVKYSAVYVDFDDTLILQDRVNTSLVAFLYQCINEGIRLVLLTKHAGDVKQSLRQYRLSDVFDDIIHLEQIASKADYIVEPDAILIDDSFSERKAVSETLGILTFDSSMIEMLIDERT